MRKESLNILSEAISNIVNFYKMSNSTTGIFVNSKTNDASDVTCIDINILYSNDEFNNVNLDLYRYLQVLQIKTGLTINVNFLTNFEFIVDINDNYIEFVNSSIVYDKTGSLEILKDKILDNEEVVVRKKVNNG